MRTEREMRDLILGVARDDDRIRAVVLNGSRANPEAPRDIFQDYDVVFIVHGYDAFLADPDWIDRFGRRTMLQMPEKMRWPDGRGSFAYLILLEDGNRIDLTLVPLERHADILGKDSESILLLDKDGILPSFPPASDSDYHVAAPSRQFYDSCCNNYWWCTQNVAKGLWRGEVPYAMTMFHTVLREELHSMVEWRIACAHGFSVSSGKFGKYFRLYLEEDEYRMLLRTYSSSDTDAMWDALSEMCGLFRAMALRVAAATGFEYPAEDDQRMTEYLKAVRRLPRDATSIRKEG